MKLRASKLERVPFILLGLWTNQQKNVTTVLPSTLLGILFVLSQKALQLLILLAIKISYQIY